MLATLRSAECRLWVSNGYGGRSTDTSGVPQIADDLLHGTKSSASGQFRTNALAEKGGERSEARTASLRIGAPTLAGNLSGPAIYEVEATGSEMVQWAPSAFKANVVRAPN
jgi:hypothetical protein